MYGDFVWARRALNGRKRRFPARAEDEIAKLISGLGMELSKAQVQGAIKEMDGDEDADGTIEVAEFEAWWFLQKYGCPKIMCPPMNGAPAA